MDHAHSWNGSIDYLPRYKTSAICAWSDCARWGTACGDSRPIFFATASTNCARASTGFITGYCTSFTAQWPRLSHTEPRRSVLFLRGRSNAPSGASSGSRQIRQNTPMRRNEMAKKPQPTTDAVAILHRRTYQSKPERLKVLEEARANEEIARKIHALRTQAGLTQAHLGKMIGTTASVI